MEPLTVFVTNREIDHSDSSKLFGNDLDPTAIHFASAKQKGAITEFDHETLHSKHHKRSYDLSLENDVDSYLQTVLSQSDNGKPWIFFLHGNNQTLSKNLVKSRRIQDEYDANMIIFSWPSCSYEPTKSSVPKQLAEALLSFVTRPNESVQKKLMKWTTKWAVKKVNEKKEQYKEARAHAKLTVKGFSEAFNILQNKLLLPMQNSHNPHSCFLAHSLGHLVLRSTVEEQLDSMKGYQFNSCMLHQADEENSAHATWVKELPFVEDQNTYITRNKSDIILFLSGLVNNGEDLDKALTRLGNREDDSEQRAPLNYIDFTGMSGLGIEGHGIAWRKRKNKEVDEMCRPVLTGL